MEFTYESIKKSVEKLGYSFFTGDYNINLIGVRTKNRIADNFDDYMVIAYQKGKENIIEVFDEFTTDPGIYYLKEKLLNPNGCAIAKPGQYKGLWQIGVHNGKYTALIQTGNKITVYRDRDKDDILEEDPSTEQSGYFGINCHHGYDSGKVRNHSAGCQVFKHKKDLERLLDIAFQSRKAYGNKFTYTLLTEAQL